MKNFETKGGFAVATAEFIKNHSLSRREECLSAEENQVLRDYFYYIGKSDYLSQREYFHSVTVKLEEYSKNSGLQAKKQTDIYIKIGFLLGLALVVLLV